MVRLKKTDLDKMTELQYVLWTRDSGWSKPMAHYTLISLAITPRDMTDVKGRKLLITALKTVGHIFSLLATPTKKTNPGRLLRGGLISPGNS